MIFHFSDVFQFFHCLLHKFPQRVFKLALQTFKAIFSADHTLHGFTNVSVCEFAILARFLAEFMSALRVLACLQLGGRFTCENVLNRQYFVKELELLFGAAPVLRIEFLSVELKSQHYKSLKLTYLMCWNLYTMKDLSVTHFRISLS